MRTPEKPGETREDLNSNNQSHNSTKVDNVRRFAISTSHLR